MNNYVGKMKKGEQTNSVLLQVIHKIYTSKNHFKKICDFLLCNIACNSTSIVIRSFHRQKVPLKRSFQLTGNENMVPVTKVPFIRGPT